MFSRTYCVNLQIAGIHKDHFWMCKSDGTTVRSPMSPTGSDEAVPSLQSPFTSCPPSPANVVGHWAAVIFDDEWFLGMVIEQDSLTAQFRFMINLGGNK